MCKKYNVNVYAPAHIVTRIRSWTFYRAIKFVKQLHVFWRHTNDQRIPLRIFSLTSQSSETLTKESYDSILLLRHRPLEYQILGFPRCKLLFCCMLLFKMFFPLFYDTREFHRFLLQVEARFVPKIVNRLPVWPINDVSTLKPH